MAGIRDDDPARPPVAVPGRAMSEKTRELAAIKRDIRTQVANADRALGTH